MYHAEEKQDNIKEIKIDKKDKDIDLGPLYNNEENNVDEEDNFTSCKYCTFVVIKLTLMIYTALIAETGKIRKR